MSLDFIFLSDTLVFTSTAFWFCIGTFITYSSAVADGKLLTLLITVLDFDSRCVIFTDPVSLGIPLLWLQKAFYLPVAKSF